MHGLKNKSVTSCFFHISTKLQDTIYIFSPVFLSVISSSSAIFYHVVRLSRVRQYVNCFYRSDTSLRVPLSIVMVAIKTVSRSGQKPTNGLSVTAWTGLLCRLPWRQRARNIWSSLSGVLLDRARQMCVIWLELLNRMPSNCLLSEVWHTPGCAICEGHVIRQYCTTAQRRSRGVCEKYVTK